MKGIGMVALLFCLGASHAGAEGNDATLPAGPWGNITCRHFFLEVPDAYLRNVPAPPSRTVWRFPSSDYPDPFATVESLLEGDPELFREFDETCTVLKTGEEFRIYPTDEVVARLSGPQRLALCRELGKWPVNRYHFHPIRIEAEDPEEWFDREGISAETRGTVAALAFRKGDSLLFCDVPLAIRMAKNPVEERSLRKAFSRTRTLLLQIHAPVSDREEFVRYWSAEGRMPGVIPILESIAGSEEGASMSLYQALPPLAKKHLYSYPSLGMGMDGVFPGNWWTSANFVRFDPDPSLLLRKAVLEHFDASWEKIPPDAGRFPGDVILLIDRRTGRPVTSCVHIAANVVFTKKSPFLTNPWILTTLQRIEDGMINRIPVAIEVRRLVKKPYVQPLLGRPKRR